jgi:prepilin-type N-terminal cleavage/methylation domain-containing protein
VTRRGFTLLEVMVGLSLLGFGLVVLIKSAAGSIFSAQQANLLGVATDLSREKMYEIEETLLKDGYQDTDIIKENESFSDEGWPEFHYSYKIVPVELPSLTQLQELAKGKQTAMMGSGSAAGSAALAPGLGSAALGSGFGSAMGSADALTSFQDSALGGMIGMIGGGFGGSTRDAASAQGNSFIQSQYQLFQNVLKVSIRKVTLTVSWKVMGRDRDLTTVAFFTDQSAMDKVMMGMGSVDLDTIPGALNGSNGFNGSNGSNKTPGKTTK